MRLAGTFRIDPDTDKWFMGLSLYDDNRTYLAVKLSERELTVDTHEPPIQDDVFSFYERCLDKVALLVGCLYSAPFPVYTGQHDAIPPNVKRFVSSLLGEVDNV